MKPSFTDRTPSFQDRALFIEKCELADNDELFGIYDHENDLGGSWDVSERVGEMHCALAELAWEEIERREIVNAYYDYQVDQYAPEIQ